MADLAVRNSLAEANLLKNQFDTETATMLAKISKQMQLSLCGITSKQTTVDFTYQSLEPADAILIAASLEFRASLTKCTRWGRRLTNCTLLKNNFDVETATMLANISKDKQISLCGITAEQTEANFSIMSLQPAD
eukprot:5760107-Prymnesium_polylepis.1